MICCRIQYLFFVIIVTCQAWIKREGCVRPRQPTQNFVESLWHGLEVEEDLENL